MLPTKRSCIHKKDDSLYMTEEVNGFIPYSYAQHLYILSNEEIKEGDWQYFNGVIKQASQEYGIHPNAKKVIATTDSSLRDNITKPQFHEFGNSLPRPSNYFMNAYVKAQGKGFDEILVEYTLSCNNDCQIQFGDCCHPSSCIKEFILRVAQDNTITIKPLVKKMYTSDELREELMIIAHHVKHIGYGGHSVTNSFVNHWMEENKLK